MSVDYKNYLTGLKDKNGKDIREGQTIRQCMPAIEYQTHTGDNIPNGSYTEPIDVFMEEKVYIVEFVTGCFMAKNVNNDDIVPLFYLGYLPDGNFYNYDEIDFVRKVDYKRNRDLFDNDYTAEKEMLEALCEEYGIAISDLNEYCRPEIIEDEEYLKTPVSWQVIKDFVNSIPEKYLPNTARIDIADEGSFVLLEPYFVQQPLYMYDNDSDMVGDLESLKADAEANGYDFDESLLTVLHEVGEPFLWTENF